MKTLTELLHDSALRHAHLCPRQVLGVRMGMLAGKQLGLELPQTDKRLLAIAEMDGCLLSGIGAASGCWAERRTLIVKDYGKTAVTFVDTVTREAIRITPDPRARKLAAEFAPAAASRWEAMLLGYQRMPDELLLSVRRVEVTLDLDAYVSREGWRVNCAQCGEEIMNERQIVRGGLVLCRVCAGDAYYRAVSQLPADRAPKPAPQIPHLALAIQHAACPPL